MLNQTEYEIRSESKTLLKDWVLLNRGINLDVETLQRNVSTRILELGIIVFIPPSATPKIVSKSIIAYYHTSAQGIGV
ncbi:hypothetical protein GTQ43_02755 [Nostoc sp. KVJ3]|uniref:hypothetical protein n=1 Tax=Nostoc sp. KVJ3 TaxID=457945 RepID=UPI0022383EDC|nr:hypothetical protein [Nostoc sp. KVJ3]MCW5312805.1 hypothetical protein [Nostoc sp. KVJ3]